MAAASAAPSQADQYNQVPDGLAISPEDIFVDQYGKTVISQECGKCKYVKPLSFFHRKTANKRTGRQEFCKRCMAHKEPMSAEEEIALKVQKVATQAPVGAEEPSPVTAPVAEAQTETPTETAAAEAPAQVVPETYYPVDMTSEQEGEVSTTTPTSEAQREAKTGHITFSAWIQSEGTDIFVTPDFAVVRPQKDVEAYTVKLSITASEATKALANFIPSGLIPANTIQLVVRALGNQFDASKDVWGNAYY